MSSERSYGLLPWTICLLALAAIRLIQTCTNWSLRLETTSSPHHIFNLLSGKDWRIDLLWTCLSVAIAAMYLVFNTDRRVDRVGRIADLGAYAILAVSVVTVYHLLLFLLIAALGVYHLFLGAFITF